MLLTVGKYMMAAALTLAAVTTVFMVLFFREKPESVAAAEPIAETTAEAAEPEDYSQPWLDIPEPKVVQAATKTTEKAGSKPAKSASKSGESASKPGESASKPGTTVSSPVARPAQEEETGLLGAPEYGPMPDRGDLETAHQDRRYQLARGAIMGLTVPKMDIFNAPVYDSDRQWALHNGVAHVPETSLPWSDAAQRNVYLAGHRLGWPETGSHLIFYRLNTLEEGDLVVLKDRGGRTYRYRVTETFIVDPNDSWVMGQVRDRDMVTLQTCTPIPTFDKRIIVRADRI